MIRVTFEGSTEDIMKELKEFMDNMADGVVIEVPKNRTAQGVDPDEPKVEAAAAPEPTMKEYKLEELQAAMQPFINTKLKELQELLAKFQVVSLVDLPKEQYSDFAGELRTLGATI